MCRHEIYTLELTIMIRPTHLHTLLCCDDVQIFFSGLFPKKSITLFTSQWDMKLQETLR